LSDRPERGPILDLTVRWRAGQVILALAGIMIHFIPMLTDRGASPELAATAAGSMSIFAIISGGASGFLLDRFSVARVAAPCFAVPALGVAILLSGIGGQAGAFAAAATIGIAAGVIVPVLSIFVTRYVGMLHYGAVFSVLMAIFSLAQGAGAILISAIHDRNDGYGAAFVTVAGAFLLSAALVLRLTAPLAMHDRSA